MGAEDTLTFYLFIFFSDDPVIFIHSLFLRVEGPHSWRAGQETRQLLSQCGPLKGTEGILYL